MDFAACPSLERAPLMVVMEYLSREKQRRQRNLVVGLIILPGNQGGKPLVGCGGEGSIPPEVLNTSGVKDPCSTSLIWSSC